MITYEDYLLKVSDKEYASCYLPVVSAAGCTIPQDTLEKIREETTYKGRVRSEFYSLRSFLGMGFAKTTPVLIYAETAIEVAYLVEAMKFDAELFYIYHKIEGLPVNRVAHVRDASSTSKLPESRRALYD